MVPMSPGDTSLALRGGHVLLLALSILLTNALIPLTFFRNEWSASTCISILTDTESMMCKADTGIGIAASLINIYIFLSLIFCS